MWLLLLIMLHGQVYAWPEPFDDRAACERAGSDVMSGQGEVVIIARASRVAFVSALPRNIRRARSLHPTMREMQMSDEDLEKTVVTMIYPRSWSPDAASDSPGIRADRESSLDKARRIIAVVRQAPMRLLP
jgi:hypothetical protein